MKSSCQTVYASQWTKSNKAGPMGLHSYIYSSLKPQNASKHEAKENKKTTTDTSLEEHWKCTFEFQQPNEHCHLLTMGCAQKKWTYEHVVSKPSAQATFNILVSQVVLRDKSVIQSKVTGQLLWIHAPSLCMCVSRKSWCKYWKLLPYVVNSQAPELRFLIISLAESLLLHCEMCVSSLEAHKPICVHKQKPSKQQENLPEISGGKIK